MKTKASNRVSEGIIYEVRLAIEPQRKTALMKWLQVHIDQMLQMPGFMRASILLDDADVDLPDQLFNCVVRYQIDSMDNLRAYFADQAESMRAMGVKKFGDALKSSRSVYRIAHEQRSNSAIKTGSKLAFEQINDKHCMNCEMLLLGAYCHSCGQRYQRKVVPIFEMISEFVSGMFNWDSRFWRTMSPLLFRPGHLTKTYIDGMRERYLPPIRMYFVTSIVFFLAATLQPKSMLRHIDVSKPLLSDTAEINFGSIKLNGRNPTGESGSNESPPLAQSDSALGEKAVSSTSNDLNVSAEELEPEALGLPYDVEEGPTEEANSEKDQKKRTKVTGEFCDDILNQTDGIPDQSLRVRLHSVCKTLTTRRGLRDFALEMMENLPVTLMFLLPFMAFAHKIFYIFSRRYYVEHLLFYIHSFSFLFTFATLILGIFALLKWRNFDATWLVGLSVLYVIYYFLRSMRVVYGQGRIVTFIKWSMAMGTFIVLAIIALTAIAALTASQLAQ